MNDHGQSIYRASVFTCVLFWSFTYREMNVVNSLSDLILNGEFCDIHKSKDPPNVSPLNISPPKMLMNQYYKDLHSRFYGMHTCLKGRELILLYAPVEWALNTRAKREFQWVKMRVLRAILGVAHRDRRRHLGIRREMAVDPLLEEKDELRW